MTFSRQNVSAPSETDRTCSFTFTLKNSQNRVLPGLSVLWSPGVGGKCHYTVVYFLTATVDICVPVWVRTQARPRVSVLMGSCHPGSRIEKVVSPCLSFLKGENALNLGSHWFTSRPWLHCCPGSRRQCAGNYSHHFRSLSKAKHIKFELYCVDLASPYKLPHLLHLSP